MKRRIGIAICMMLGVVFALEQARAEVWDRRERKTDRRIERRVDRKTEHKAERRDALVEPERPALERVSDRRIDRKAERAAKRKKERRDAVRGEDRRPVPGSAADAPVTETTSTP